jgi:hypothetical protein
LNEQFIAGAEAFRKMVLLSVKPIFWPHMEGVFQVFAETNGFTPKEILNEVAAEKEAQQVIQPDNAQ